jgi:hypothetical protein
MEVDSEEDEEETNVESPLPSPLLPSAGSIDLIAGNAFFGIM